MISHIYYKFLFSLLIIGFISCKKSDDVSPDAAQVNKAVSLTKIDSLNHIKLIHLNSNNDPDSVTETFLNVNGALFTTKYALEYDVKKRLIKYSIYPNGNFTLPNEYYVYFYTEPRCNPDSIYYYRFNSNFGYKHYVIKYNYDAQDRPVKVYYKNPDSSYVYFALSISYDAQGNLTQIKQKNGSNAKIDSTLIYKATSFDNKESWYRSNKAWALTGFTIPVANSTLEPFAAFTFLAYYNLPFPNYGIHNPTSDTYLNRPTRVITYTYNDKDFPTQVKFDNSSPLNLTYK